MNKIIFAAFLMISFLITCCSYSDTLVAKMRSPVVPVLTGKEHNPVLKIEMIRKQPTDYSLEKIVVSFEGTTDLNDIERVSLFKSDSKGNFATKTLIGEAQPSAPKITFRDNFHITVDTITFWLSVTLKDNIDLSHRVKVTPKEIVTNAGKVGIPSADTEPLRVGVAVRQHGQDGVHTSRIPGLATTNKGTLMAIYDARYESARDLQGHMDIAMNRSHDGGRTWEPMQIVIDMNEWGGLPEKFNGVSDACILVDENTGDIYVAGLWMHGVINPEGKWVKGLTEDSKDWNHQWRDKGSQPGFDVKQTSQFLITKSTDDGKTWSEPENLTQMCKKEEWWLWAPAPGHGITLSDGTLVFPTQGRDKTGRSFSNITWSKDGGKTWTTSAAASTGTTENMAVQLTDGSIMLNARSGQNRGNLGPDNGRVISISSDLGQTWSKHPTSRNALIEPTCMASLHKHEYTQNGQKKSVLLFSNPNSRTDRDHMTIKVSFDDGKSWPEEYWLLLDEKKGRGYSCLTSVDEKTIGILYESSTADLVFQKIALQELIGK